MEGFVGSQLGEAPDVAPTTMGYYTRADLPFHYALADAFTILDGYHCSVLGETDPNRQMSLSAWTGQDGRAGGPVTHTVSVAEAQAALWSRTWTSMPERLSANGVSWKLYNSPSLSPDTVDIFLALSNNVLAFFRNFRDPASELHKLAFDAYWPTDFVSDVNAGELPQVSWVLAPLTPV